MAASNRHHMIHMIWTISFSPHHIVHERHIIWAIYCIGYGIQYFQLHSIRLKSFRPMQRIYLTLLLGLILKESTQLIFGVL